MARILTEGFEFGDLGPYTGLNHLVRTVDKRVGSISTWGVILGNGGAGDYILHALSATLTEIYLRIPFFRNHTTNKVRLVLLENSSNQVLVEIKINNATQLAEAYVGAVLVATGTVNVPNNVWNLLEAHVVIHGTTGTIETKINNNADISFSGDTDPYTSSQISYVRHKPNDALGPSSYYVRYDDLAYNDVIGAQDNSWVGDGELGVMIPSGVGTYTQVPNVVGAATHWEAVDDAPPDGDTSYVWGDDADVNKIDSYVLTDPPSLSGKSIQRVIVAVTAKQSAVAATSIATFIRSGATDAVGTTRALTTSYARYQQEYLTDPNTGLVWTEAGVQALEAGFAIK